MSRKTLHILCFGDSLTAGYFHFGLEYHPYSIMLQTHLEAAFPDTRIEIVTDGASGDRAAGGFFLKRLEDALNTRSFDWVIILGGTNDIAFRLHPKILYNALRESWSAALSKGSKVLALTVPECEVTSKTLDLQRDEINNCILTHEEPNFYAFNLKDKLRYHSLPEEERNTFWDDGLHLTDDGYDWMGGHIAEALIEILTREEEQKKTTKTKPKTRTTSKRQWKDKEDFVKLDEEDGTERNISQGYVVVRKKDLYY